MQTQAVFLAFCNDHPIVDTVQDFLIKLGIKPRMNLLEMAIFFTISCHRQTNQNYEQSWQKLGTFLVNKVL